MLESLLNKVASLKVFKNTYFEEHLLKAASDFKSFSSLKPSFEEMLMIFNKKWKSVLRKSPGLLQ